MWQSDPCFLLILLVTMLHFEMWFYFDYRYHSNCLKITPLLYTTTRCAHCTKHLTIFSRNGRDFSTNIPREVSSIYFIWMDETKGGYRLFYWIEVCMCVAWETSVVRITNCPVTCYQHSSVFIPPPPPPPPALSSLSRPLSVSRYPQLTSSTTETHQKRDQSEFNKQNQLCLTGWADWELGIVKTQNVKVN